MIKFTSNILPPKPYFAVSGGVDSMGGLSFLTRGKNRISGVVTINHRTNFGAQAEKLVVKYCEDHDIPCHTHSVTGSSEEEWREARKAIFAQYPAVITAHHLDDVVEWWLLTSLRGNGRLTPSSSGNVYHPFLKTRKSDFEYWCAKYQVPFINDPTNFGVSEGEGGNDRAKLRVLMPSLLGIYPGIHASILKKLG